MRVLGIDLAAQPENTGACLIGWAAGQASATTFATRLDDQALIELAAGVDMIASDAPLGWPERFAEAVWAYHTGGAWPDVTPGRAGSTSRPARRRN
jgi:predicted nuclease with RNAse H fold